MEDGIIRCRGRLQNAPITYDARFPIFLPRDTKFTVLVVQYYHKLVLHNGVKETLNQIRSKFWIPQSSNSIKRIIRKCFLCRKYEGAPYSYPSPPPPPPPLPVSRLSDNFPFKHTALNYAGPFYVRNIYPDTVVKSTHKAWIFLFSCASTRVLYLDLVPDASAVTCIRALKRFFSNRGVPNEILSDKGVNLYHKKFSLFVLRKEYHGIST